MTNENNESNTTESTNISDTKNLNNEKEPKSSKKNLNKYKFVNDEDRTKHLELLVTYSNELENDEEIDVDYFCKKNMIGKSLFWQLKAYAEKQKKSLKQISEKSFDLITNKKQDEKITIKNYGKSTRLSIKLSEIEKLDNENINPALFKVGDKFDMKLNGDQIILTRVKIEAE
jgi:hypothetical protein